MPFIWGPVVPKPYRPQTISDKNDISYVILLTGGNDGAEVTISSSPFTTNTVIKPAAHIHSTAWQRDCYAYEDTSVER